MVRKQKDESGKVSLLIPKALLEEIDNLCAANFFKRTHWLVQAAIEKLEKERLEKSKALLKRLEDLEK